MSLTNSSDNSSQSPNPIPGQVKTVTLEPLREPGLQALDCTGIDKMVRIRLCKIEVAYYNEFHEIHVNIADDLLKCAASKTCAEDAIPDAGTLTEASFEVEFSDSPKSRQVVVGLPCTIKTERPSDAPIVERWLAKAGMLIFSKVSNLLLALTISTAMAAASPEDDGDEDNDRAGRPVSRIVRGLL